MMHGMHKELKSALLKKAVKGAIAKRGSTSRKGVKNNEVAENC